MELTNTKRATPMLQSCLREPLGGDHVDAMESLLQPCIAARIHVGTSREVQDAGDAIEHVRPLHGGELRHDCALRPRRDMIRFAPYRGSDRVPAREQLRDCMPACEAAGAGDEDHVWGAVRSADT